MEFSTQVAVADGAMLWNYDSKKYVEIDCIIIFIKNES